MTVSACLERIAQREPAVRGWAYLEPEPARDGLSVGVKDVNARRLLERLGGGRGAADAVVLAGAEWLGNLFVESDVGGRA